MYQKSMMLGLFCAFTGVTLAQQSMDSTNVQQLDEVVITNSKFEMKRENSGKVITKINQAELQRLQGQTLAQIINATVGIEINGTKGNAGQNLAYYVRGGRNRQVLVLIDGVPLTDPSQIANDYDLRLINTEQIESIEILKGASSTLYGSGAATAVINVTLKKPTNAPLKLSVTSVMGTNQTQDEDAYSLQDFTNSASISGSLGKFNYLAGFSNEYSDGLSAIANGTETDVYNAIHGNLKVGYSLPEKVKVSGYAIYDKFKADFDDGFLFMDADNRSISEQFRLGLNGEYQYNKGSVTINGVYNDVERQIDSDFPAEFYADSYVLDAFNRYTFQDTFFTVLGVNVQENSMESFSIPFGSNTLEQSIDPDKAHFTIVDPYLNVVYMSDFGLNVNAGVRMNNHSEYGSHWVYSVNPSYKFDTGFGYVKGLASYSTAYITPSLYQLFEPSYGNDQLQPEENQTLEVGAELSVGKKLIASLVYFNRWEENFIDFVDMGGFVYQYANVEESFQAKGLEFTLDYAIMEALKLRLNTTYTKVEEDLNLRIPELKVNTSVDYQLCPTTFARLSYQYNDDRQDAYFDSNTFQNQEVVLESYSLVDFYVSHSLLDQHLKLFAGVNNILNADYAELYGYSTRGRNVYLGFNLSL